MNNAFSNPSESFHKTPPKRRHISDTIRSFGTWHLAQDKFIREPPPPEWDGSESMSKKWFAWFFFFRKRLPAGFAKGNRGVKGDDKQFWMAIRWESFYVCMWLLNL